jgi:hypothetical protein
VESQKLNGFEKGLRNEKQRIARTAKELTTIHEPVDLHQLSISGNGKLERDS